MIPCRFPWKTRRGIVPSAVAKFPRYTLLRPPPKRGKDLLREKITRSFKNDGSNTHEDSTWGRITCIHTTIMRYNNSSTKQHANTTIVIFHCPRRGRRSRRLVMTRSVQILATKRQLVIHITFCKNTVNERRIMIGLCPCPPPISCCLTPVIAARPCPRTPEAAPTIAHARTTATTLDGRVIAATYLTICRLHVTAASLAINNKYLSQMIR